MKKNLLFIDAETDGLYGPFLTVAIIVVDENGAEIERGYYGIERDKMQIQDSWTKEHVLPLLGAYEACESVEVLLERFWEFWMRYERNCLVVADVPYPVECRLFEACVRKNASERMFHCPFPLLDLSSMLYAKGMDPLIEREKLLGDTEGRMEHNALDDVIASVKIWRNHIRKV